MHNFLNKMLKIFIHIPLIFISSFLLSIEIDGVLSEKEWKIAKSVDQFITVFPDDKSIPKYKTEIKYFSNEEGIYFGAINQQPRSTQTSQKHIRDFFMVDADRLMLMLDFNGNADAGYEFSVTLGGSLRDAIVTNENDVSDSWDAVWYAKTSQAENEWYAEFFIPWGVAPMLEVDGEFRDLNVSIARRIHVESKFVSYPGLWLFKAPYLSKFATIQIKNKKNISKKRSIDFFPYVSATNNFVENNRSVNFGGEIFWDIDSESKLDVSFNPDFGQVESDDVIVNFSANETFYPDKRPFFTENQSLFSIVGWDLQFINTRRIGAIPDKCSETNKSHLDQCDDYVYDSTDINLAARYTKKGQINEYGVFGAFEDDTIFSEGRNFIAARYKRNLNKSNIKLGYLLTHVDRPSINRKASVNTVDYEYKPAASSRFYGWLSEASIKENGIIEKGYGLRTVYTNRYSSELFGLFFLNYHDENFDINDMGYIRQYDNFSYGAYFKYIKPNLDKNSSVSQSEYGFRIGHQRSTEGGYGNGVGLYFSYDLQFRDSSKFSLECECLFTNAKDYEETRKYSEAPFIEKLPGILLKSSFTSPRTSKVQSIYKLSYSSNGYEDKIENLDLRSERTSFGFSNVFKPYESMQLNIGWFDYQKQSNWNVWSKESLFGYYDKEFISSNFSIDYFIGSNQEFRIKSKIYGLKAQNPRAYRVNLHGLMNEASDSINAFQLSETAFQIRYKYEFSPLSNFYVVYTRGGKITNPFTQEDNFYDIYSNAWTNQTLDKFIVKIRLKF